MAQSTISGGRLTPIEDCYISIPGYGEKIYMRILPDISDGKSASYNDEPIIGRSFPMKTFSHSENRAINWTSYFMILEDGDAVKNLNHLRAIQSAVYPRDGNSGAPYAPPPVCVLSCGKLLREGGEVCAVLKSYSVKFPTDVAWDEETKIPYKFSVDTQWDIVYSSNSLPGQSQIIEFGA